MRNLRRASPSGGWSPVLWCLSSPEVETPTHQRGRLTAIAWLVGGSVTRPGRPSRTTGLLRDWGGVRPPHPWTLRRCGGLSLPTGRPRARRRARDGARQRPPPSGYRPLGSRLARDPPRAPHRGQGRAARGDRVMGDSGVWVGPVGVGPVGVGPVGVGPVGVGRPMTGHRAVGVRRHGGRNFRG